MGIYQSSGRAANPLGVVSVLVGVAGAFASIVLWAFQYDPNGAFTRSLAAKLGYGFALGDGLTTTALVCGAAAVAMAIAGSLGGRMRGSGVVAIVLGVVALSYPVLTKLDIVARPLMHHIP
jgi:hypothetical protein